MNKVVLGLAFASVVGCASSQADRVRDARMAEIDAQTRQKLAQVDARTSDNHEQLTDAHDATKEQVEGSETAGAEARGELVEISGERRKYYNDATGRLDKLSIRLDAAKEKAEVLGANAPSSIHTDIETAVTEQKLLKQRVSELPRTEPAAWPSSQDELDRGLSTLDERIKKLDAAIGDV